MKGLAHVPRARNYIFENKFSRVSFLANCHWQFAPSRLLGFGSSHFTAPNKKQPFWAVFYLVHLTQPFANPENKEMLVRAWMASEPYRSLQAVFGDLEQAPVRAPQRRLVAEEEAEIITNYRGGASQAELGRMFGVHRTTVLYLLRREGVVTRRKIRKLNDERVEEAIELYGSGLSLAKVGKRLGVSASTVGRTLARAGVRLRPS